MRRLLPLLILVAVLGAAYALGLHRVLTFEALAERRADLAAFVAARPALAALAFVGVYAGAVAVSLPGAVILSLAGGLLFGHVLGTVLTVIGATLGAAGIFLAARTVLAEPLARRAGPLLDRIRPGLERDGFNYLLALRLAPVFPFWLVNLAPALVGMRLGPFVLATFIGIIPATAVFVGVGAGLGEVLAAGRQPDLGTVLTPGVILPLVGLALLSLLPILWRRWKERSRA